MKKLCLIMVLILGGLLLNLTQVNALDTEMAEEFAALSGLTRQAMELSTLELTALVERCDRLLEKTDSLKASERKVMRKKIERLRGLFLYVLSSKSGTKEQPSSR